MSAPLEDEDDADDWTRHGAPPDPGRHCAEILLESGDLVIYDGETPDAWIQSTVAMEIDALV